MTIVENRTSRGRRVNEKKIGHDATPQSHHWRRSAPSDLLFPVRGRAACAPDWEGCRAFPFNVVTAFP